MSSTSYRENNPEPRRSSRLSPISLAGLLAARIHPATLSGLFQEWGKRLLILVVAFQSHRRRFFVQERPIHHAENVSQARRRGRKLLPLWIHFCLDRRIRLSARVLSKRKYGRDCRRSYNATNLQDFHLFPTVSEGDVKNICPWRHSGSVVQLAFICERAPASALRDAPARPTPMTRGSETLAPTI